ncbi:MAG TPA: DUF4423 domain-containing protein, partial [Bdellovibrionales bacterium]|nr:DUF4423 domain-containing protein [Bdellovibrionales bacterium]
ESLVDELPPLSESSRFQELSADTVELLGNWEYFAILSLLETKGFRYSPEAVADRLQLNRASVVEAMKLLLRVGLLKEHANGYMPTHKNVTTTHDVPSAALRRVHRQTIEKALGAIEGQTVEERDFSGMTMAIARKKLPQAKQLIRKFRREMSALLEDGDRTDVYRLNIQLFSLESKKKERS